MKKNILIALISLVLMLGIAEFVLRVIGLEEVKFRDLPRISWVNVPENVWVEHHPVLGWYAQKNKAAILESAHFPQVIVHTNSAGFRGSRDYSLSKPADVIRIAVLGDSFVFGFGVRDEEAFPALLESSGKQREVLNLGVPGYGIDQIYLSYKEIAKQYRPDIVLIGIFPEDFWRATRAFADSGHAKPYFTAGPFGKLTLRNVPVPPPFTLTRGQFPPVIEKNTAQKLLNMSVLYRLARKPFMKLLRNMRLIDPDTSDEWVLGRAILGQMIEDVRAEGAVPVMVLLPPRDWAESTRKTTQERSLVRFAEREKVDLINLRPTFNDAVAKDGLETYYIKNDWHWTPQGHAWAARAIEDYFNQKGN